MKAWQMSELGDPWHILKTVESAPPELSEESLLLEVLAADINFADILQCQGQYQVKIEPPFVPGMYCVGRVLAIAQGADPKFRVGDVVIGPTVGSWGGFAEQALVHSQQSSIVPADIDPQTAIAMHVTYGTAWFALHLRGQLNAGETVLVLAAAGGVGSAAVELAKAHGCWVMAAAGGAEKVEACRKLGADEVIDYNREELYERVMSATDGRGVDVVYDPVGGRYFDIARRVVAWEGRLLVIGFASGEIPSAPMNHVLVKNYSVVGVHMGGYRGRDDAVFGRCYEELYGLLRIGKIAPLVDSVVGFADLPDALTRLAQRKTTGRVVFKPMI